MTRQAPPSSINSLESRARNRGDKRRPRAQAEVSINTKPPAPHPSPSPSQSDQIPFPLGLPLANGTMRVRRWFDLLTTGGYKSKCNELVERYNDIGLELASLHDKSKVKHQTLRAKLHKAKKINENFKAKSQKIMKINEKFKTRLQKIDGNQ